MGNIEPGRVARPGRAGWSGARGVPGVLLAIALAAGCAVGGCTVGGSALIAPYASPPLESLTARPILSPVGAVLALAPNGYAVAVADPVHGICIEAVGSGPATFCAKLQLSGKLPLSAAFSPDGETIAVGQDVAAQGNGQVWLVDARTGDARQVPGVNTAVVAGGASPTAAAEPGRPGSSYISMFWNSGTGHLLLVSRSGGAGGAMTRLIDLDPGSLVPRVVAPATGLYEFQTGDIAGGGRSVIFTVTRGDQIAPNLVKVDLDTGARKESGPLGPAGTQLVPLAVSPDGAQAMVGSATYGDSGPCRRLDLATGTLTEIAGLTGNFALAAYSPNGAQVAFVSLTATGFLVQVAASAGGPARSIGQINGALMKGSRLAWSGLDVLSISGARRLASGAVLGWTLRRA